MLANTKPPQNLYSWHPQILNVRRPRTRPKAVDDGPATTLSCDTSTTIAVNRTRNAGTRQSSRTAASIVGSKAVSMDMGPFVVQSSPSRANVLTDGKRFDRDCRVPFSVSMSKHASDVYRAETGEPHVM